MLKNIGFSLLTVLIFFGCLEIGARILGAPPGAGDFVEATIIRQGLPLKKPKDEIRIFTFGESTMHGSHYAPVSSPARWLEFYLKDFLPDKNIRVINFARPGRGIYFTHQAFRETLPYKPDYAFFYNGHNDFFPHERKDEVMEDAASFEQIARKWLLKSNFIAFIYRQVIKHRMKKDDRAYQDIVGNLVIETYPNAMEPAKVVKRTDPIYQENLDFFGEYVEKILALGKKKKVELFFFLPVSNLKDFRPILSIHHMNLSKEGLESWKENIRQGDDFYQEGEWNAALAAYHKAYEIDPTYAELNYKMGEVYFELGEIEKAKARFKDAKNYDGMITRATEGTENIYWSLANQKKLNLIDTEKLLLPHSATPILGEPIVEDNVHFSLEGHALMARQMVEELVSRGLIAPQSRWQLDQEKSFEGMRDELGVSDEKMMASFIKVADYYSTRYEERIRYAQKAVELRPTDPFALRSLAWAYWVANQKNQAKEIYGDLKKASPEIYGEVMAAHREIGKFFAKKAA